MWEMSKAIFIAYEHLGYSSKILDIVEMKSWL